MTENEMKCLEAKLRAIKVEDVSDWRTFLCHDYSIPRSDYGRSDPVQYVEDPKSNRSGWVWYDETWGRGDDLLYASRRDAVKVLTHYCETQL